MSGASQTSDDEADAGVDVEIAGCLNFNAPKSFFLFAGAGSGKTRSLVKALGFVKASAERKLQLKGQRVAVITYTKAARDEIKERLKFDPLVQVSTIHSFIWSLIEGCNSDIREWLRQELKADIEKTAAELAKNKAGTKTALEREKKIESYNARLAGLDGVRQFLYSPDGNARGRDYLNHAEVLQIGAAFLTGKPTLRGILINRYPALLIDESQDTSRVVMEALLSVQAANETKFVLGLFGDTMQRIYADGIKDITACIPGSWAKPAKVMNHRCPTRVVQLINKIRSGVDGQAQKPRSDAKAGLVRVFLASSSVANKADIERHVTQRMAEIGGDEAWKSGPIKTLILEHHMAALRMGFMPMFEALGKSDRLRTGMVDGSLGSLRWFSKIVLPMVAAKMRGDEFKVASIVRAESPLLSRKQLKNAGDKQSENLAKANEAVEGLMTLWANDKQPTFGEVLLYINKTGLLPVPDALKPIANRTPEEQAVIDALGDLADEEENQSEQSAYEIFLSTPFSQIGKYDAYIEGEAEFDTHQGVKGLEFPRVMVIADDSDARGFLFSYDKLFGIKGMSPQDLKNEADGKETGIDRTKRLFYVTCSRAESDLAIVAYSDSPKMMGEKLIASGWFLEDEIELIE